ncbi:MAG: nuclease superfamily protein, partial [Bacillus sp. (in: firmicutes)]|nr:nuclease superfamily protein [Bacillus sp. (in: firmicutes)]
MENKHYFYVLECRDGSFYGGYTNHLERRIMQHNEGKGAKYTRGRG